METLKVQTGTKYDTGRVSHHAIRTPDGQIVTACGAGVAKQEFYVYGENEGGGSCVRCRRSGHGF